MSKFNAINDGISTQDIPALREALGNICYTDSSFTTSDFEDALADIKAAGINVFDTELKGDLITTGKTAFTKEDLTRAIFKLKRNFCLERIDDVKQIGKQLVPEKTPKAPKSTNVPVENKVPTKQNNNAPILVGVVIVVIIGLIIWKITK